jgi:hypothetical protein
MKRLALKITPTSPSGTPTASAWEGSTAYSRESPGKESATAADTSATGRGTTPRHRLCAKYFLQNDGIDPATVDRPLLMIDAHRAKAKSLVQPHTSLVEREGG